VGPNQHPELRVFVVSPNGNFQGVLPDLLKRHAALEYCGAAFNVREALAPVRSGRVDLVVSDSAPKTAGDVMRWRELREGGPGLFMITNYVYEGGIILSILAGASGHVLAEPGRSRTLLDAIVRAARGEFLMPPDLVARLRTIAQDEKAGTLVPPERLVLDRVLDGATDAALAEAIGGDVAQAHRHIASLAAKLT
jgi:DNA-binding NarL/FixJ family response regulator